MAADKVRLCRYLPPAPPVRLGPIVFDGPRRFYTPCIGRMCGAYDNDSGKCKRCSNPPNRWFGDVWIIEVTREQFESGDFFDMAD